MISSISDGTLRQYLKRQYFETEIPEKIKTSRPGSYQPLLLLPRFAHMPKLCPCNNLKFYLETTSSLRGDMKALFIKTTRPYRAASRDTISNWLKKSLELAEISIDFTPHSIRHASVSTDHRKEVNISVIKNLAGWSEKSRTFGRFYNRPIVDNRRLFAEAVLSRDDS